MRAKVDTRTIRQTARSLVLGLVVLSMSACQGDSMDIIEGARTPEEVRRTGNRLRDESSLYLQQHAQNPVDWFPWAEEALARARQEDKPIFLSSGYSSCHWCHVMEHEVFEHDDVAAILNKYFVCIKVDREELPDVDATYMEAVQIMTGGGGWPMSVLMTPDLEPFFGGTYIPHDQFLGLLNQVVELWTTRRSDLENQASQLAARLKSEPDPTASAGSVDQALLDEAATGAAEHFDKQYGGYAGERKFPVPVRWQYLLHHYRRTGDAQSRQMTEKTLEAMAQGGLRDHVGGAFHRYTVDPHWTVPHFEIMLYDNAQLATLYFEAGEALERPDFTAVGVDVLEFLDREMSEPGGAIYASYDADSGGEEGSYYVWTPAQLVAAVGSDQGPALAAVLGVSEKGNFEHGASVVTRRVPDPDDLFAQHRQQLRDVRSKRTPPGLDTKVITAWNGLAMSAFARGAMATGRQDFRQRAEDIAAYLDRVHRDDGGGLHRASNAGVPTGQAVLEDHSLLARGLLDLYQVTGEARYLAWATDLVGIVQGEFSRADGAWYDTPMQATSPVGRRLDLFDSVIPSGSSVMVDVLITHGALTGNTENMDEAGQQIEAQAGLMRRAGLEMAGWYDAALRHLGPLYELVVAGDLEDGQPGELLATVLRLQSPGVVVTSIPADGPTKGQEAQAPLLKPMANRNKLPILYTCQRGMCQAPSPNVKEFNKLYLGSWKH